MRSVLRGALAASVLTAASATAQAADLPSLKGAPLPPPPPAFSWTGLYGGINIGYGFGDSSRETGGLGYISPGSLAPAVPLGSAWGASQDLHGVIGGGQVGYNHQVNPWLVLGLEADIQATDVESKAKSGVGVFDATGAHLQTADSTKAVDWFGTVRARVGFTLPSMPNLMVYGTGGFAYGQVIHNVGFADNFASAAAAGFAGGAVGHGYSDDTRTGWTAGGGVEWSPIPNWSVKAEYLYVDLGSTNANSVSLNGGTAAILGATTPVFAATQNSPTRFHNVRVGLNWHFDPFAPGLVARADGLSSLKEPPPPAFVDSYQPFQVRLKVGSLIPLDGHGTVYDQGIGHPALGSIGRLAGLTGANGVIAGASTNTSTSIVPMLDVAYYLTKNWAIEAICCVAPHHIQGTGTIASDFARAWVFPPSLMAQYHFTNFGQFQPYLGVGANFTAFWGTRVNNDVWGIPFAAGSTLAGLGLPGALATFQWATVAPSWGVVGQVGFDYMFNEHWGVNVDVKYVGVHPMVHATAVAFVPGAAVLGPIFVPVKVSLPINPLVVSAGVTYRFGGGLLQPVLAKY
ncbi:MAG TPA: OmpW family outer membrane protein [Methylosinus sp.]|jgi:outer membrane immunogenic protein|uniref:OmpW family outer membrane protein n=1 Tax=Methylosinus sp. TaxID=427 RepID=UPI002F935B96